MDTSERLFLSILKELDRREILKDLVIIGGWALVIYRHTFGNPPALSSIRTADVDFLVSTKQKFSKNVDVGKVFSYIGFEKVYSMHKGYIKYVHPDLEAEFLVPMIGRQSDEPFRIPALNTNAQRLRFLDILITYSKILDYSGFGVRVPKPAAYVINKLIVSTRRQNRLKMEKDIKAARELGEYILNDPEESKLLKTIWNGYSLKMKTNILDIAKIHSSLLFKHLSSEP